MLLVIHSSAGLNGCLEIIKVLPCTFPLRKQLSSRHALAHLINLSNVVDEKFGAVLDKNLVHYAPKDDGAQRVKCTSVNVRTLMEMLFFEYVVEPLNELLRTPLSNTTAWTEKTNAMNDVLEHMGTCLASAFRCSIRPISGDEACEQICNAVANHLGVALDECIVRLHLSPVFQRIEPTMLLVNASCRSSFAAQLLGNRLPRRLRVLMHCETFHVEAPAFNIGHELLAELVETRSALTLARAKANVPRITAVMDDQHGGEDDVTMQSMLTSLYAQPPESKLKVSISVIESMLNNNVALKNAPTLFADAFKLFASIEGIEAEKLYDAVDKLVSRPWITATMQHLEIALDELIKDLINKDLHCLY